MRFIVPAMLAVAALGPHSAASADLRFPEHTAGQWSFEVQTLGSFGRFATAKIEAHGVYASPGECEADRATISAELDQNSLQQPYYVKGQEREVSVTVGNLTRSTKEPNGPLYSKYVSPCRKDVVR